MKVTTIEENQDINTIKVDGHIGYLKTFDMVINDRTKKQNKSIAFVSNTKEDENQCEKDTEESLSYVIVLVGRNFNKALKILGIRQRTNVEEKVPHNFKNNGPQCKNKDENKPNKVKGIHCHECEGFGHIKSECPKFLKKQKRVCQSLSLILMMRVKKKQITQ